MLFTPCCLLYDGHHAVKIFLFVSQVLVTILAPTHILSSEPASPFQNVNVIMFKEILYHSLKHLSQIEFKAKRLISSCLIAMR